MSSALLHAMSALTLILSTAMPMEAARAQVLPTMVYGARPTCDPGISLHPGLDTPCEKSLAKAAVGAGWVPASDSLKQTQWVKGAIIGAAIGAVAFGTLIYFGCELKDETADCRRHYMPVLTLLGAFGGGVTGALIGGAFSKPAPSTAETGAGR
jgi:hypothetical protein